MHETTLERAITLAIFIGSYVGLGLVRFPGFRVDRTGVAIIGGALMVLSGVLPGTTRFSPWTRTRSSCSSG